MLIRAITSAASVLWELQEDQLYDMPEEAARELIAQGLAEPAAGEVLECATTGPREQAARVRPPRIRKSR
jgi:hypothetical protein